MSAEQTRVVLVKPGDVLLIGGVALAKCDELDLGKFFQAAGIEVALFEDDISIKVARSEILDLARAQVAPELAAARREWQALRERMLAVLEVDPESRPLPTVEAMVESLIRRAARDPERGA